MKLVMKKNKVKVNWKTLNLPKSVAETFEKATNGKETIYYEQAVGGLKLISAMMQTECLIDMLRDDTSSENKTRQEMKVVDDIILNLEKKYKELKEPINKKS